MQYKPFFILFLHCSFDVCFSCFFFFLARLSQIHTHSSTFTHVTTKSVELPALYKTVDTVNSGKSLNDCILIASLFENWVVWCVLQGNLVSVMEFTAGGIFGPESQVNKRSIWPENILTFITP